MSLYRVVYAGNLDELYGPVAGGIEYASDCYGFDERVEAGNPITAIKLANEACGDSLIAAEVYYVTEIVEAPIKRFVVTEMLSIHEHTAESE